MSKETEKRSSERGERTGGGHNEEIEHDGDAARRASNASLRRVAEVERKPPKPKENLADIREAADSAAYESMFSNILLLAKRMHAAADDIRGIIDAKADEGGSDKKIMMIKSEFKLIQRQAIRLRMESAGVQFGAARTVGRDLEILHGGYADFARAMTKAAPLTGKYGEDRDFDMRHVKDEIEMLNAHFGHTMKGQTPRETDERIEHDMEELEANAIKASIASMSASAKAIEANQWAGASIDEDVWELISAVGQTKTFLEIIPPDRIRKTASLEAALAKVKAVMPTLEADAKFKPRLANAAFSNAVAYLQSRVKKPK